MVRFLVLLLLIPATLVSGQTTAPQLPPPQIEDARRLFDQLRYEDALPLLTQILLDLQSRPALDQEARGLKAAALELRARARFGLGDRAATREDLRDLLLERPSYTFAGSVTPRLTALLDEVRKATVGSITVTTDPADALVEIDGSPTPVAPGGPIPLTAGSHRIVARKPGHRAAELDIAVQAGTVTPVTLALERVSAVIVVFSTPSGVSISLDGKPAGVTKPGPASAPYHDWLVRLGYDPAKVSAPLEIPDVASGAHEVRYDLACHVTEDFRVDVPKPADYRLDPTVMKPSVGSIRVAGGAGAGTVFLDGQPKGASPLVLTGVCSGPHTVEVRSTVGRLRTALDLKPGDDIPVSGSLRPAIAVLSTSGARANVAAADVLAAVERLYAGSRTAAVFVPSPDALARAMAEQRVSEGWLTRLPGTELSAAQGADALAESARRESGLRLARAFDAQALAEVVFAPREGGTSVMLRLLAAGSGRPEDVEIYLDSPARSVSGLDREPIQLTRLALPVDVLDVADVDGVVVLAIESAAGTGITPGDVVMAVNGKKIVSGAALERALAEVRPGERVRVGIRDRAGVGRQVELAAVLKPRLESVHDRGIGWNKTTVDLRARLASLEDRTEIASAQLNLAVALIRLGNWVEAGDLLAGVRPSAEGGIGRGTVLYLQGLCAEALGDPASALTAFRAAAAVPGALLTEDGPPIAPLVAEAETRLGAGPRRHESGTRHPTPGA